MTDEQTTTTMTKAKSIGPKIGGVVIALAVLYYVFFYQNPRNAIVPTDWQTNEEFTKTAKHLDETDKKLLVQALVRDGLAKLFNRPAIVAPGMTVGELIAKQKDFVDGQTQQDAKAAEVKKEVDAKTEAAVDEINKDVIVSFISKRNTTSGYSEFIELQRAYKNDSGKDIAGIKGVMVFKDIFGDKIIAIKDSMDHTIKAGETYVMKGYGLDYNQFMPEHQKLYNTGFDKIKFVYVPQAIVFTDGTKITLPETHE